MIKKIYCVLSVDGMHCWQNIPDTDQLNDVQFLKSLHRHIFNFKCVKVVDHNDRHVEFIHLKRDVLDFLHEQYYDDDQRSHMFGSRSCEMLAEQLISAFDLSSCEVSEDGENGSIVEVDCD